MTRGYTVTVERHCDTLTEALALAKAERSAGRIAVTVKGDEITAMPCISGRWTDKPKQEWAFTFKARDGYKTPAHYRAEAAGIRYASHRRGYIGSNRATERFAAEWDSFEAECLAERLAA